MTALFVTVVGGLFVTVVGGLILLYITTAGEEGKARRALEHPLDISVTDRESAPDFFGFIVQEPARLPTEFDPDGNCADEWRAGLEAGGIQMDRVYHHVDLSLGRDVESGVTITDLRAVVTSRNPAPDGTLVGCGTLIVVPPTG
ncbi:MAG: hypothetical protein ACRDTD_29725, partial [Pseudonocardiaceae bacterium]